MTAHSMTTPTAPAGTPDHQHRPKIVFLGPQRNAITIRDELVHWGVDGRIAAVTAGWQEREAEDDELQDAIGHRAVNLRLHARVDAAFAADPALFAMHRRRQDRLRRLQDLYRLRLDKYLDAALELFQRDEPVDELPDARDGAVQALRDLDSHHVELLQRVHEEFEEELAAHPSAALQHQRGEVAELIASCGMVAIAGGQVATLLGRLRLLDVRRHLVNKPLLAWSAGAMVLTERVVLFHDRPPEGPGNAELLEPGLGLAPGIVALPHASARLRLDDLPRTSLFSQRFAPSVCVALDPYARARWDGAQWRLQDGTWRIGEDGTLVPMP
jgi:hypothetical protein